MTEVAPSEAASAAQGAAAEAPPREGPFGPIPGSARLTLVWVSLIVQLVIFFASAIVAVIAAIVPAAIVAASGQPAIDSDGSVSAAIELSGLLTAIAVQFPVWALLIVLWVKSFERRSLASAGFRGPGALGKYGVGLLVGLGIAFALALFSPLIEPEETAASLSGDISHLLRPEWLVLFAGVVLLFLVQGACEEIAFRGWMLSAVAARRGIVMGVLVNSVVFGLFHIHVFASGFAAGLAAILALTCVGLFVSLWAVSERSLAGVCGIHGAFNASAVVMGMAGIAATDPEASPGEVLLETIREATALQGDASSVGALLQLLIFLVLSGLVWMRLKRRGTI